MGSSSVSTNSDWAPDYHIIIRYDFPTTGLLLDLDCIFNDLRDAREVGFEIRRDVDPLGLIQLALESNASALVQFLVRTRHSKAVGWYDATPFQNHGKLISKTRCSDIITNNVVSQCPAVCGTATQPRDVRNQHHFIGSALYKEVLVLDDNLSWSLDAHLINLYLGFGPLAM